jgi:hypothetical protein
MPPQIAIFTRFAREVETKEIFMTNAVPETRSPKTIGQVSPPHTHTRALPFGSFAKMAIAELLLS